MRILGVDPGSHSTGYGLIETDGSVHSAVSYGAIRTGSGQPLSSRLLRIHNGLGEVLALHQTDMVAVENVFYAANVQSALKLGHARGIVLLVAAQHGLEVFEYSPLEVKGAITGYGRAEKRQVQSMVRFLLRLPETALPDDAADALAVAICHSHRHAGRPERRSGTSRSSR